MQTRTSLPATNLRTPPSIIATIIVVSALASALICYLVYFHAPLDVTGAHLRSLPLLNAVLNALCTVALVIAQADGIDSFTYQFPTPTPEPSSLLLLLIGTGMLALLCFTRKKIDA